MKVRQLWGGWRKEEAEERNIVMKNVNVLLCIFRTFISLVSAFDSKTWNRKWQTEPRVRPLFFLSFFKITLEETVIWRLNTRLKSNVTNSLVIKRRDGLFQSILQNLKPSYEFCGIHVPLFFAFENKFRIQFKKFSVQFKIQSDHFRSLDRTLKDWLPLTRL